MLTNQTLRPETGFMRRQYAAPGDGRDLPAAGSDLAILTARPGGKIDRSPRALVNDAHILGQNILEPEKTLGEKTLDQTADERRRKWREAYHRYKARGCRHRVQQERKALRAAERAAKASDRLAAIEARRAERRCRGELMKDPEFRREYMRAWRAANRDRMRELKRSWKARNPDKVRGKDSKSTARKRARLVALQKGRCAICGTRLGADIHVDHIIPRARGGSNRMANLQATHPACNIAKSDHDPIDFARSLGRLL